MSLRECVEERRQNIRRIFAHRIKKGLEGQYASQELDNINREK